MRWFHWMGLLVVAAGIGGYFFVQNRLNAPLTTDADLIAMRQDTAAQNETAFHQPAPLPATHPHASPQKNVYFGDLHGHSNLSFDAYLFGNRLTVEQSYEFSKGKPFETAAGETMQLTRPLDFAAMTDHAEGFGLHEGCDLKDLTTEAKKLCDRFDTPNASFFLELRNEGEKRPPESALEDLIGDKALSHKLAQDTWADIVAVADKHNSPGKFTTFAAYEYSPPLPDTGKIHRNIIYRNNNVPDHAVSAFHALTELDLWRQLSEGCSAPCEYLTIPHNPNKTWGLAFASHTIDGDIYTEADWKTRDKVEPIVEMFQIKGNSECALGVGTTDEECNFEQFFDRCEEGEETLCIHPTSMIRDGLKKGLKLEEELGINPLDFGMIGSTDTHNSNLGDTEEWDFRGMAGSFSATAKKRIHGKRGRGRSSLIRNPGGLAAIWAEENTRDALFDAMLAKEVYATSGTRIKVRFFGSFNFPDDLANQEDAIAHAYASGVPMGGKIHGTGDQAPSFFILAEQDSLDAPLDKIQIVKGWRENGESYEKVVDVVCSDGRTVVAATDRCSATVASVDLSNCAFDKSVGSSELRTIWTDPDYAPDQNAFYYARVIQNPTCRWSTYDALRLGEAPPDSVSPTSTEMAWSSPIWVQ